MPTGLLRTNHRPLHLSPVPDLVHGPWAHVQVSHSAPCWPTVYGSTYPPPPPTGPTSGHQRRGGRWPRAGLAAPSRPADHLPPSIRPPRALSCAQSPGLEPLLVQTAERAGYVPVAPRRSRGIARGIFQPHRVLCNEEGEQPLPASATLSHTAAMKPPVAPILKGLETGPQDVFVLFLGGGQPLSAPAAPRQGGGGGTTPSPAPATPLCSRGTGGGGTSQPGSGTSVREVHGSNLCQPQPRPILPLLLLFLLSDVSGSRARSRSPPARL